MNVYVPVVHTSAERRANDATRVGTPPHGELKKPTILPDPDRPRYCPDLLASAHFGCPDKST
jgi:hypothetical protein